MRKLIYATNPPSSRNGRFFEATKCGGRFPDELTAKTSLYLAIIEGQKNRPTPNDKNHRAGTICYGRSQTDGNR